MLERLGGGAKEAGSLSEEMGWATWLLLLPPLPPPLLRWTRPLYIAVPSLCC